MSHLPSLFSSRIRTLTRPWSDLDDIFSDMLSNFKSEAIGNGARFALDVEELEDRYVVEAEMPGVDKKNIDITLQDRLLTIKSNESGQSEKKDRNFVCKERWQGSASRSVTLPLACDAEAVDASIKDGLLKVIVKKLPASKTKKIAVQ